MRVRVPYTVRSDAAASPRGPAGSLRKLLLAFGFGPFFRLRPMGGQANASSPQPVSTAVLKSYAKRLAAPASTATALSLSTRRKWEPTVFASARPLTSDLADAGGTAQQLKPRAG